MQPQLLVPAKELLTARDLPRGKAICGWLFGFGVVLFFFLSVQLGRQMGMHICHYGSINGLDFLDVILFNGARSFIA